MQVEVEFVGGPADGEWGRVPIYMTRIHWIRPLPVEFHEPEPRVIPSRLARYELGKCGRFVFTGWV